MATQSTEQGMPYKDPAKRKACHDKWVAANPERNREHKRKWREANLEQVRKSAREYGRRVYAEDPEKHRESRRLWMNKWQKEHPEESRARGREQYRKHRVRILDNARLAALAEKAIRPRKKMSDEERRRRTRERNAARYHADPEKHRRASRESYARNRDKYRGTKAEWEKKNRRRRSMRESHRYQHDVQFRLRKLLRAAHHRMLKGRQKKASTRYVLGCSFEEAQRHIEMLFVDGMGWHNTSEWHIDHIRPLISFDLDDPEQFAAAGHYTNLQPLWGADNLSKLDKWEGDPVGCRGRSRKAT